MLLQPGSPAELLEDLGTAATCLISSPCDDLYGTRKIMVESSVSALVKLPKVRKVTSRFFAGSEEVGWFGDGELTKRCDDHARSWKTCRPVQGKALCLGLCPVLPAQCRNVPCPLVLRREHFAPRRGIKSRGLPCLTIEPVSFENHCTSSRPELHSEQC